MIVTKIQEEKMKKHLLTIVFLFMLTIFLVACEDDTPPIETELELSRITISLTDNTMIDYGSVFNVLSGVSAVGDDAMNYTSQITYSSTATISATHLLDTTVSGVFTIQYTVTVGSIVGQRTRTVTVKDQTVVVEKPQWVGFNMTVVNGETDVTITYTATPALWWNNNAQLPVPDFDGTKETVQFVFTGVAGHEYLFKVEGPNAVFKEQPIFADGTEQVINVSLASLTLAQRETLNLIVFFVKTLDAAGTVVVKDWTYGEPIVIEEPKWTGYGMTAVDTATDVTLTYTATPTNWWENNAQLPVVNFNGTKTSIKFTFTGVATHEYLFKIEGPGGVNVEQPIIADGTEQTVTLNLSALTEAQRNSFNLIIVFVKTVGAAGTVVVKDWMYGEPTVPAIPVWTGFGMTAVESETAVTITYSGTPANWWESNAQLPVIGFNGVQTSIKFTFTGVATHEYLFKIEGPGGVNVEQPIIADGTEQTVTLDLSGLTKEQRDSFNKIVFFVKTLAASGTVVVKDWMYGNPITWTGYGMTAVDTATDVTLTYTATPTNWWENNAQSPVVNFDGKQTSIKFTFTGVATHEYLFKIEGPGGVNVEQPIIADGTEQTVTLNLSTLSEAQRNSFNLVIVFVKTVGAAGTVTVKDWVYGEPVAPSTPVWMGYGMTVVQTATEVTITYTATPTNWWDNNARLSVPNFDETKTSIQFTFTGVSGQEYVFKIEGPGGVNVEATVLATGSQQVYTLNISSLSLAQREVLNLLVVFSKTPGASGTIIITNVQYS
jgi:uncharacterized protein YxeA